MPSRTKTARSGDIARHNHCSRTGFPVEQAHVLRQRFGRDVRISAFRQTRVAMPELLGDMAHRDTLGDHSRGDAMSERVRREGR
jgi:hypothetical protein